jgi:hypothetical protein
MMAQAARDPLFWACMTVAGQDSIWALGNPNAVDLCERCHFPQGWLGGRSDPPNASAMTGSDFDGLHCDVCHTKWDPFFETTYSGVREGNDWTGYWDEATTLSSSEAQTTYVEDRNILSPAISLFNGDPFYGANRLPVSTFYTENAGGQYFISSGSQKRASFADAAARHQMLYSRYHKSRYFCGTCHDVSNPALANLDFAGTPPGDGSTVLTTESDPAFSYFHVERTFSEFMLSAYGQQGGAPTNPEFQAQGAANITRAATCQDCHMRDVVGVGCNKAGVPVRPTESTEHPKSGQPLHDLTGGNVWISHILASLDPNGPVYDSVNAQLLGQGPAVLTLDLNAGMSPKTNGAALRAGSDRALQQLRLAATIKNLTYDSSAGSVSFRIQNNTAHKLISGFPEGRRMFVNIKAYSGGNLIYEVNPYDYTIGTLKGLPHSSSSPALGPNEMYRDELVYEVHPGSDLTGEDETFHFVLATGRYKDNRIPPKGFNSAAASSRLAEPVWHGTSDPNYFSAAEYAGGYDDQSLTLPAGAASVTVTLYYQTTSREYIEFLRDEINGTASTLPGNGAGGDPAYLVQSDPFFSKLKAWGNTIWQLWEHNKSLPGAEPIVMAQAITTGGGGCAAPAATLESAVPGQKRVTLTWSDEHVRDPNVTGYKMYYDQAGKAQLIATVGLTTTYTDSGLTNGLRYCYKVTSLYAGCESNFSNIVCAVPTGCEVNGDCDDGLFCNGQETCDVGSGICQPGTQPCPETACNHCQESTDSCFDPAGTLCASDGTVCTDDVCNGAGSCTHVPNTAPCDDGLYCNGTDTCSGGVCVHSGDPCAPQPCSEELDICGTAEDADGDGIPDSEDNCPQIANEGQEDNYPPAGNNIGDACDCEGNFNCWEDRDVDGSDASTFKIDFGRSVILNPCTAQDTCNGDFSCDGDVDGTDASRFKSDFGRSQLLRACPLCVAGMEWCQY